MGDENDPLNKFPSENEEAYLILEKVTADDLIEINRRIYELAIEDGIEALGHGEWSKYYLEYLVKDIGKMARERKHFIEISAMIMQEIVRRGDAPQPFIDLKHRTAYSIVKWIYKDFGYQLGVTIRELEHLRKKWDRMKFEEYKEWLINHTKAANSLRVSSSISNLSENNVVI